MAEKLRKEWWWRWLPTDRAMAALAQKLLYGGVFLIVMYLGLWLLFLCGAGNVSNWGCWVELLNGATWPADAPAMYTNHPKGFAAILALRTVLNFSAVVVVVLLIWELFRSIPLRRREGIVTLLDLLNLRDAKATNEIIDRLKVSSEADENKVRDAIEAAGRAWAEEHLPILLGKDEAAEFLQQKYTPAPAE